MLDWWIVDAGLVSYVVQLLQIIRVRCQFMAKIALSLPPVYLISRDLQL